MWALLYVAWCPAKNQGSIATEKGLSGYWGYYHTHTPVVCFHYSSQREDCKTVVRACHSVNDMMVLSKYLFGVPINKSRVKKNHEGHVIPVLLLVVLYTRDTVAVG